MDEVKLLLREAVAWAFLVGVADGQEDRDFYEGVRLEVLRELRHVRAAHLKALEAGLNR